MADFRIASHPILPAPGPAEVPFTSPHYFNRCVTDTGKILPRKYTGLTSKYQRAVTKTLKRSRHMLLHK